MSRHRPDAVALLTTGLPVWAAEVGMDVDAYAVEYSRAGSPQLAVDVAEAMRVIREGGAIPAPTPGGACRCAHIGTVAGTHDGHCCAIDDSTPQCHEPVFKVAREVYGRAKHAAPALFELPQDAA